MGRGLSYQEVLGPSGQVLQVEANAVGLCQRVQVDRVEPKQVVTGELPDGCHFRIGFQPLQDNQGEKT